MYQLLDESKIENYLSKYRSECNDDTLSILDDLQLDFSRPFEGNAFKIPHILLQHPITEMYSLFSPDLSVYGASTNYGFLLLLNKEVGENADSISWKIFGDNGTTSARIYEARKILYSRSTKSYRLSEYGGNSEDSEVLMERTTWVSDDQMWFKSQYRIMEKYIIRSDNGDFQEEGLTARPLPYLIHYYHSKTPISINYSETNIDIPDTKMGENIPQTVSYHKVVIAPDANISLPSFQSPQFAFRTNQPQKLKLTIMSPMYGFENDASYCILFIPGVKDDYSYTCRFADGNTIPANILGKETIEVWLPPHLSGFVSFYIVGVNVLNELQQITNPVDFAYLPSGASGQLNLDNLLATYPRFFEKLNIFKYTTKIIYLSNNNLVNVDFLQEFLGLEILILNNNHVDDTTQFPYLPSLLELHLNGNLIQDFSKFALLNTQSMPNISEIQTFQNPCNPYLLNADLYEDYRRTVVSFFPSVKFIDSAEVTDLEKISRIQPSIPKFEDDFQPVPDLYSDMDLDFNVKEEPFEFDQNNQFF